MHKNGIFGVCAASALAMLCGSAVAQQKTIKDQLVGTWLLTGVTAERADGSKGEPFGPNPKGIIIFTADGHFSLLQQRAELPKIAANDRAKATPEEARAVVDGSIAYYGTYTVNEAEKTMMVKLVRRHLHEYRRRPGAEADRHRAERRRTEVHQSADARGRHVADGLETRAGALEPRLGLADAGVLPGAGETPAAPVFIDGKKAVTLRGPTVVADLKKMVSDHIEKRYGAAGAEGRRRSRSAACSFNDAAVINKKAAKSRTKPIIVTHRYCACCPSRSSIMRSRMALYASSSSGVAIVRIHRSALKFDQ